MDIDRLVLAVIQPDDVEAATHALTQAGIAVTLLSSVGGFLGTHNVTLLMGLPASDVARALNVLAAHCHPRHVPSAAPAQSPAATRVGSATILVLAVARYLHLQRDNANADYASQPVEPGKMQLVLVIVANEPSGELLQHLTDWSYRATRFSTVGGFSHHENTTLLIGARSERVNSIVNQIRQVCAGASAPNASATIFVVDVAQHTRLR